MRKIKFTLFVLTITFLFEACTQNSEKEKKLEASKILKQGNTKLKDLPTFKKPIYGFVLDSSTTDTFKIVSYSAYFEYCFGSFSNPQELKGHFGDKYEIVEEISQSQSEPSGKICLYKVKLDGGFINFYQVFKSITSENTEMVLVSAKITKPSSPMTNGLKVGLTRDEVEEILFKFGQPKGIRNYNNILIATVIDGVWVHLNFEKDRLSKIVIKTIYTLKEYSAANKVHKPC